MQSFSGGNYIFSCLDIALYFTFCGNELFDTVIYERAILNIFLCIFMTTDKYMIDS